MKIGDLSTRARPLRRQGCILCILSAAAVLTVFIYKSLLWPVVLWIDIAIVVTDLNIVVVATKITIVTVDNVVNVGT